jgi:hypothetical protein
MIEIGDIFIIKPYKKCIRMNKRFRATKFSKSGLSVYYFDLRTNNPCKCNNCIPSTSIDKLKCIGISSVTVVEKKIQYERNIKLKTLL